MMTYDPLIWDEFVDRVRKQFPKSYVHFDRPISIDPALAKLKSLLQDESGRGIARHSFLPFIKNIIKTPRFRYDDDSRTYALRTKERPISFASHFDALIISYFDLVLKRRYQEYITNKGFSDCVLAYRDDLGGRCNIQFAKEVFDQVIFNAKSREPYTAIGFDIKGYFDSIPHGELKKHWGTVLNVPQLDTNTFYVFKALTKYSYAYANSLKKHFNYDRVPTGMCLTDMMPKLKTGATKRHEIFNYLRKKNLILRNESVLQIDAVEHPLGQGAIPIGIPQGSPISATLSNVFLIQFDMHMYNLCKTMGNVYRRYCDDILIICKTKDAAFIHDRLVAQIEYHGLKIQGRKTEIVDFRYVGDRLVGFAGDLKTKITKKKKLQYLGFEFDGERVYIRPGSLSTYFRKMKSGIRNLLIKAYGKHSNNTKLLTRDLFAKYSHVGKTNFITYAYRAASSGYGRGKNWKPAFNSPYIKKQLARHFRILKSEVNKENEQRYALKQNEISHKAKLGKKSKMPSKRIL